MRGQTRRAGRLLVTALGGLLGALHAAVLARRVADGTLFEPLVIAQWLSALGLVAVAVLLRRRGVSVFRGRPAAAFWIVIALMHGMVALPTAPGFVGILGAIPVTGALPVGAGFIVGALAVLTGLLGVRPKPTTAAVARVLPSYDDSPNAYRPSSLAPRAPPA